MHKKYKWIVISITSLVALCVYWSTAYQTITWWDNSSYPIVAHCLGVESPPGSLFLTILGGIVLKLTFFEPKVFALNLFAGFLAVTTLVFLFRTVCLLLQKTSTQLTIYNLLSISLGLLVFAFSETFWTYATQFTPYMLTTCMTAILLYQLIKFWFEDDSKIIISHVFIISLLIGLDFSIHRTNALLVPAFIGMILLKDLKLFSKLKFWLYGVTGLVMGIAVHLLKIPMALADPIVNFNDPSNLSRFYDYVSLKQYGGGFLSDVFTRKAPIFSVQTMDYINAFVDNFISFESPLSIVSLGTILLVLATFYFLCKENKKTALMLIMLFVVTTVMTIFYFNIPENFFRSLTRHYLPSFVIFALFVSYGAGVIMNVLSKKLRIVFLFLILLLPLNQIIRNYNTLDGSDDRFASDYANNILVSLKPNATLFVMGDVLYPIFYMQQVEGKRPDVNIVSLSLTNTQWYMKQLMSEHYHLPLILTDEEIVEIRPKGWTDTTIVIPFEGDIQSYQIDSLTSVSIPVPPTYADKYIMGQDLFVLELIKQNRWRQPVYFTQPPQWLKNYSRPEGLVYQLVPQFKAEINREILQKNLLENYKYDGYTNLNRPLDFSSKNIGSNLWTLFIQLASKQQSSGDSTAARATIAFAKENLPLDRVIRSDETMERFKSYLKILEQ